LLVAVCATQAVAVSVTRRALLDEARYLFAPPDWLSVRAAGASGSGVLPTYAPQTGGTDLEALPIDLKFYRARDGDTLSDIALRFGLTLDTVASLNRDWGRGVHLVRVGEAIRIPNQNGLYLPAVDGLETLANTYGLTPDLLLRTNGVSRQQVGTDTQFFVPGAQHSGWERSLMIGAAFRRPVTGWVTSDFGTRSDPFSGQLAFHRGIDIAATAGTPVRASLDGRVTVVAQNETLGSYVIVSHFIQGHATLYAHLQQTRVAAGVQVTAGQVVGTVGSTGRTTGPHLHFEVWRNGTPIDAALLIPGLR